MDEEEVRCRAGRFEAIRQGASFFPVEAVDPDRAVKAIEWRHSIRPIEDLGPFARFAN